MLGQARKLLFKVTPPTQFGAAIRLSDSRTRKKCFHFSFFEKLSKNQRSICETTEVSDCRRDFKSTVGNVIVLLKSGSLTNWWVDPDMMPDDYQSHSITALLIWTGERNYNKNLMD